MRIGTLFSGIGAPEQAAGRVYGDNLKMVFACEYDDFARQSFLANYDINEDNFHKDIYEMDGTDYTGNVDILIGGSPCQAFSIAGLRKGLNDKRGELIYEYIRLVNEVKAPFIVYENVKGMLSIDNGKTIKEFVQALRDIGYHCHYGVLNSKDYGIPQNRERLFLVGFLDAELYHSFSFMPKQKLTKRLRDVLESEVDEKYYLSHKLIQGFMSHKDRHKEKGNGFLWQPKTGENIANCLRANASLCPTDNTIKEGVICMLDIKGNESIRRVYGVDGNAPCLQTMQGGNREPKIQIIGHSGSGGQKGFILSDSGICNCLTSTDYKQPKQIQKDTNNRIRKLTPRECLRLQDFPDTFKQVDKEYVKYLFDTIDLDFNSEIVIKETVWEMLKNIISQDVTPMDAIVAQSHSGIALCTTKDSKNMVMPIMSLNTRIGQKKNANTVIALLEKGSRECVYDTITLKELMEMQPGSMSNQAKMVSVKMDIGRTDMQKSKQTMDINIDVELMLHLKSEENWTKEKLYIILTSIRQMMMRLICGYSGLNLSILVHMELLKDVELNCSKEDLLSLRMGNINFVSDSQMYKQAGNSMTVAVLEMIFNQIEKAKRKEITTLF